MTFPSFTTYLAELVFCAFVIVAVRTVAGRWMGPAARRLLWGLLILKALVPLTVPTAYHPLGAAMAQWDTANSWPTRAPAPPAANPPDDAVRSPRAETAGPGTTGSEYTPFAMFPHETALPNEAIRPNEPVQPAITDPPAVSADGWLRVLLPAAWGLGAVVLLGVAVWRNRAILRTTTRATVAVPDWVRVIFLDCRERLGLRAMPELIVSPCIPAPCLIGAVRPRILIPESLIERRGEESEKHIRHLLLHELAHLKQGDVWLVWLWTLALAVQWFNPLFWMLGRWFRFDCETACDDRVLTSLQQHERPDYGNSLLRMLLDLHSRTLQAAAPRVPRTAVPHRVPGTLGVAETRVTLERRLTMMNAHRTPTWPRRISACIILALLATLCITSHGQQKSPTPAPAKEAAKAKVVKEALTFESVIANLQEQEKKLLNLHVESRYTAKMFSSDSVTPELMRTWLQHAGTDQWVDVGSGTVNAWLIAQPGGKIRIESETRAPWLDFPGTLVEDTFVSAYNGHFCQFLRTEGKTRRGQVTARRVGINFETGWTASIFGASEGDKQRFSEYLANWARAGITVKVTQQMVAKVPCVRVALLFAKEETDSEVYYLDPQRGYALIKEEKYRPDGKLQISMDIESLQEVAPGVFYPTKGTTTSFFQDGKPMTIYEFEVSAVTANDPDLSDDLFTIQWPVGTTVDDRIAYVVFRVGADGTEEILRKTDAKELKKAMLQPQPRFIPVTTGPIPKTEAEKAAARRQQQYLAFIFCAVTTLSDEQKQALLERIKTTDSELMELRSQYAQQKVEIERKKQAAADSGDWDERSALHEEGLKLRAALTFEFPRTRQAHVLEVLSAEQRIEWRTAQMVEVANFLIRPLTLGDDGRQTEELDKPELDGEQIEKLKAILADALKDEMFNPQTIVTSFNDNGDTYTGTLIEEEPAKRIGDAMMAVLTEEQKEQKSWSRAFDRLDHRLWWPKWTVEQWSKLRAAHAELRKAVPNLTPEEFEERLGEKFLGVMTNDQKDTLLRKQLDAGWGGHIERDPRVKLTDKQEKELKAANEARGKKDAPKLFDSFIGALTAEQRDVMILLMSKHQNPGRSMW